MEYKYSEKEIINFLVQAANQNDGWLTTDLYDKTRKKEHPSSGWISKHFGSFQEGLSKAKILNKYQHDISTGKIEAIKNIKLLSLENGGIVTQSMYEKNNLNPSIRFINKHFGWAKLLKELGIKSNTQFLDEEQLLKELKISIKKLGYVPTRTEYEELLIKPTVKVLSSRNITWSEGMRRVGFKPYGKPVDIKDLVCVNEGCYNQFAPTEDHDRYCTSCYKSMRSRIIKGIDKTNNLEKIKEFTKKLIYNGNSDKIIEEMFKSIQ